MSLNFNLSAALVAMLLVPACALNEEEPYETSEGSASDSRLNLIENGSAAMGASATSTDQASDQLPEGCTAIEGEYVVLLDAEMTASTAARQGNRQQAETALISQGATIKHRFQHALDGFVITVSANTEAERLQRTSALRNLQAHPQIRLIEQNAQCKVEWSQELGIESADDSQYNAPWNLARLDQIEWNPERPDEIYELPEDNAGAGVTAYVLDSGIYRAHNEFCPRNKTRCKNTETRVVRGYSAVSANPFYDKVGHGTHVAASLGGLKYGVAKDVTIVSVQLSDSDWLTLELVLKGIDFVARDFAEHGGLAVANMSFGGPRRFASVNRATENIIRQGVVVATSAGNWTMNACSQTPANVPAALTVAASTIWDAEADFSNFGGCVDIFAPGEDIVSAGTKSETARRIASGTSMASPHVAGVAALYLPAASRAQQSVDPNDVAAQLTCRALQNQLSLFQGQRKSPNRLLHMSNITDANLDPPVDGAPTLRITHPANGAVVREAQLPVSFKVQACGVTRLELTIDNEMHPLDVNAREIDLTLTRGAHRLTLRAYDIFERAAEASVKVTVRPRK